MVPPELQRLHAGHAPAVLAFELANRAYFAASVSDRGDEFYDQFTERPYPDAWKDHDGSLRVNLPNRKCDPHVAADEREGLIEDPLQRFGNAGIVDAQLQRPGHAAIMQAPPGRDCSHGVARLDADPCRAGRPGAEIALRRQAAPCAD